VIVRTIRLMAERRTMTRGESAEAIARATDALKDGSAILPWSAPERQTPANFNLRALLFQAGRNG
jgi:hypothetical protein